MLRVSLLLLLFYAGTAAAHGPDNRPAPGQRAPVATYGSVQAARDDAVEMELAVDGQTIKLFVTNSDGNPVNLDIAEAKAFITSAGRNSWCVLQPAGMNMLSGEAEFVRDPAMRVDISLRLPGRKPINQNFKPFK